MRYQTLHVAKTTFQGAVINGSEGTKVNRRITVQKMISDIKKKQEV
jgi:hypothetical protein